MEEENKVLKFYKKVNDSYFCAICNDQFASCTATRKHVELIHRKEDEICWQKAMERVFAYGMRYPNHKIDLHFFGENLSEKLVKQILTVCGKYTISISGEP